jgi:metallo-beta-lactamase family protein
VEVINGYSAHADRSELLDYVRPLNNGRLKKVFVVHGEEGASLALADEFQELGVPEAMVPELMEEVVL